MGLDIYLMISVDTGGEHPYDIDLYSANITHNVSRMWTHAGVYHALYQSDGVVAGSLIDNLQAGWEHMVNNPDEYKAMNPPNGWGDYSSAVAFLGAFVEACKAHPKAIVHCSR